MVAISSASLIVESLCAITIVVRPRCRLIEDQKRRVLQEDACDRDALLLAARQAGTSLPYLSFEAVGQGLNEVGNVGATCCLDDLFCRRIRLSVGDILCNRPVEEIDILLDEPYLLMERTLRTSCPSILMDPASTS